jgi:predicted acyl esterase
MIKTIARAGLKSSPEALWSIARDHERWTTIMPGVVRASGSEESAEWTIQSPVGEAVVAFEVGVDHSVMRFESTSAAAPFTGMSMKLSLDDGTAVLEFGIDSTPRFPLEMVKQLAETAVSRLCDLAAQVDVDPAERQTVEIRMSDGHKLSAHLYRCASEVAPCIVTLFPYRKEGAFLPMIASDLNLWGYNFLIADVRGIGGSGGTYKGLWSKREVDDFVELITWAAAQNFCDGNVATFGGSYCGGNQLLVAARKPKALRCITPIVGMVDTYRDWTHRGGLPSHANWGAMTYLRSQNADTAKRGLKQYYLDFYTDDLDNDAHRSRSPEAGLASIDIPTLAIGGWHDYFLRGTVRTYGSVAGPKRIVVGPWGHGDAPPLDELRRWFDHWLRGEGDLPATPVRVFVTGADEWRELDDWPSGPYRAWHPVSAATGLRVLSHVEALPMATNVKPQFVPDPTDSGMSVWSEDATFDTEPFEEATLLLGHVGCTLRLSVDGCDDAAVRARVSVVSTEGRATQLNEGRLRLSQRAIDATRSIVDGDEVIVPWHTHEVGEPLDGVFDAHIEIDPIGHQFSPGDRLRVGITLTRADEGVEFASAVLHPESRLLLPFA